MSTDEYANITAVGKERVRDILSQDEQRKSLKIVHGIVRNNNGPVETKAQKMNNEKTGVILYHFHMEEYLLIHLCNSRRHRLSTGWVAHWRIVDGKSKLLFRV